MTTRKTPVVQQMAEATAEATAPSAAEQAKAEKEAAKQRAEADGLRLKDEVNGYHTIVYSGVTMFELNNDRTRQFANERDAQEAVASSRVAANLAV